MPATVLGEHATKLPTGTTAQRPESAATGMTRYNTSTGSLEFYNGVNWISTNLIPAVNSVTGTIYAGLASTLTLSLTNATDNVTVRFTDAGITVADVVNVVVTGGSASVTVPALVYGKAANTVIVVTVINVDGTPSSNGVSKTVTALPTGGTITTSGSFRIHTFNSSSSFVVPSGLTLSDVEYVVVAGGGSGGNVGSNPYSGGGGAGGFISATTTLSAQTYTIIIGGGGPNNANGVNSSAFSQTSIGGGRGGSYPSPGNGNSGGSGGGAGSAGGAYSGGAGTAGQGNAGGNVNNTAGYQAAGGGGAGGVGASVSGNGGNGGVGGVGLNWKSLGTFYAGGGGGSGYNGNGGAGGNGGGGTGGSIGVSPVAAAQNRGGGGGGLSNTGAGAITGGSGIVIVRYTL